MITARRSIPRARAAAMAMVLLAAVLPGCGSEPALSRQEVAGVKSTQDATSIPAETAMDVLPTPTVAPPAAPSVVPPAATPLPAAAVPAQIARALSSLYANTDWFQGLVTVTINPGAPNSVSMILRQWFKQPNLSKLEVIRSATNLAPVGTTLVYDGRTLILYDPVEDRMMQLQDLAELVVFLNLPQERLFPLIQLFRAREFLSTVAAQATVTRVGVGTAANGPATIVELRPESISPRFQGVRLWLDNETMLPLRAEALSTNGAVLVNIQYSQVDTLTPVSEEAFAFTPPVSATVVRATPSEIATIAGFKPTTVQQAQPMAGFPILLPRSLPAGTSQQSVQSGSFDGAAVVALFYGTPETTSTTLIEKPAQLTLPAVRGVERVEVNGFTAEVYQTREMVVIDWVKGDTALTLASTLSRDQALETARSVQ